ncbi:MAG: hypothetical protein AB1394_07500 [Bacteroidota bacterium]
MALVEQLYEQRDKVRAIGSELSKLKNENYTEIYNNGDVKYFEEISRQLAMSAASIATFIDHLEADTQISYKKKFATLDRGEDESQLQTDTTN